ncbi:NAD(P)-binding protein [Aspergillus niger CBS 101883]|uniref:NAD(P)-binding protein n=1 Tax=Aspergillus lacticoffeatus (strain CBS 101883) TaxID=1450533 RepID=UPI000D800FE1|nr:NAD(P)-binding protein [Aspergillus niger CBS 101883]PYH53322.1 NAD(P)-binding protein [Aspergillus niger CBS 101883]
MPSNSLRDNVSRRKDASPLGRGIFIGLRALDVWWQHHLLTRGWATRAIETLGGQAVSTSQIVTSTNFTGLQPYYGLVSLLSLGSSIKQIATIIFVSEQETPVASAITVAAFNTIVNSVNTLLSVWAVTSQVPSTLSSSNFSNFLLANPLVAVGAGAYFIGILTEAVSEFQRTAFKKDPANKGKPYGGGLFSLATNINYGGYTIWRAGYALVTGGLPLAAMNFSFFFYDFAARGVPVLDAYLTDRVFPHVNSYLTYASPRHNQHFLVSIETIGSKNNPYYHQNQRIIEMKVGIAGITGKFARRLVTHLLDAGDDSLTIRGYCRSPSKLPDFVKLSPKLEIIKGAAFDQDAIATFVQGYDVVVCYYLGDDKLTVDGQKLLIDACESANVPRYVASDWALDYTKLKLGELFPKDPMIHVKNYLDTEKKKVSGVHILIGGFMEPIFSPFFNIVDVQTNTFRYWGDGNEIMEGTTYDDAAKYTAKVVLDPEAKGVLKFVGGRATIQEIAKSYEKVYGTPVTLEKRGSLEDLYKTMHDKRMKSPQDIYSYMSLFFYYYWINGQTFVGPELDNARYPDVQAVDWEGFMKCWSQEQIGTSYFALNILAVQVQHSHFDRLAGSFSI